MADSFQEDPRVYFAAERTLPPWVRTGLAMMGFGFVVARFGLFPAGN
jgi:putative membrane protein